MRIGGMLAALTTALVIVFGCADDRDVSLAAADEPSTGSTIVATAGGGPVESTTTPPNRWATIEEPLAMTGRTTIGQEFHVDRLPEFSDAAVRGQIVQLGPADYLVPKTVLTELGGSRATLARETSAPISTPVAIKVHEVLGRRAGSPVEIERGDELVLSVSGGSVAFTVTPEEAARTGLRPDVSHAQEQANVDAGRGPPPDHGSIPTEPFEFGYTAPEFVAIKEGEEVIAFVRWANWYDPVADDGTFYDGLALLLGVDHTGVGLFVRDVEAPQDPSGSFTHGATGAIIAESDLLDAAQRLTASGGMAATPQWLGSDLYTSPLSPVYQSARPMPYSSGPAGARSS